MLIVEYRNMPLKGGGRWLAVCWPEGAGKFPGGFDLEAHLAACVHIVMLPGNGIRTAFRDAYRELRLEARKHGGMYVMPERFDDEPCPFPDLPHNNAMVAPNSVRVDNGTSYCSPRHSTPRQA